MVHTKEEKLDESLRLAVSRMDVQALRENLLLSLRYIVRKAPFYIVGPSGQFIVQEYSREAAEATLELFRKNAPGISYTLVEN